MQLAILIAMLMLVGQGSFAQIKPLIEELGGEEVKSAIDKAEELNQIIATVQSLSSQQNSGQGSGGQGDSRQTSDETQSARYGQAESVSHPLDPIKGIADQRILSSLSSYVALGE